MKLNAHVTGLTVGSFFGLWHLLWSLLVAVGVAQAMLDMMFNLHFFDNPLVVNEFAITKALMLVVMTSVCGYIAGVIFAMLSNMFSKGK